MSMVKVPNGELRVLQALWSKPGQTAKEITEMLESEGKAMSVSTIQTLLRRLETRGLVAHKEAGKSFKFSATCKPDRVRSAHARDFVNRMFGGAVSGFVTQLIEEEKMSESELRELRDLVDSKLAERKRK